MKNILFIFLWLAAFFLPANDLQSQTITNWGANKAGLQIALLASNNVITPGSSVLIDCIATNTSDTLIIYALDPHLDTQMHLIGNGTNYDLSIFPNGFRPGGGPGHGVGPNELQLYKIPIHVETNTPRGLYRLEARIKIRINDYSKTNGQATFPEIVSGPLEIQIR